jgi:ferredoxin-type protein NapG
VIDIGGGKGDRRGFFRSTLGELLRQAARATERKMVSRRYYRPPGAVEEAAFLALCTRCAACIEVCPVHAIYKARPSAGLAANTPIIDPSLEPCVVCADMPCAKACPTGALVPPADGWAHVHMGTLTLDPKICIAFLGAECGACARACPVGEAALRLDTEGKPLIIAEGCVGCGVCVRVCPTSPSSLTLTLVEAA